MLSGFLFVVFLVLGMFHIPAFSQNAQDGEKRPPQYGNRKSKKQWQHQQKQQSQDTNTEQVSGEDHRWRNCSILLCLFVFFSEFVRMYVYFKYSYCCLS